MGSIFSTIASLFGHGQAHRRKAPAPRTARRTQLGLEVLEGRALPSVSPIFSAVSLQTAQMAYQQAVVDVPNLQGYSFHLLSSSGKPAHDLVIQKETWNADGSASFTGTWQGDGPNGSGTPKPILNGSLRFDAAGHMILSFGWTNGSGEMNNFTGILTRINTGPASSAYIYAHYHLEGDVTTPTPGDGPGHIAGDSTAPQLVAKA